MKRVVLGTWILVGLALVACSGGEQAPRLKGESPYSCRDLNTANVQGRSEQANKMVSATLGLLSAAYTEDEPIQAFFRNLVNRNFDYAVYYRGHIESVCLSSAGLSLNDAAVEALDDFYAEAMAMPRWATCRALNSGIDYQSVMQEVENPTVVQIGGSPTPYAFEIVSSTEKYGADYAQAKIEAYCDQHPDVRIWDALSAALREETREIEAEWKRRDEEAERKRWEERRQAQLAELGSDLVAKGTDDCFNYEKQFQAATNRGADQSIYREALEGTLLSLAKSMPEHQREVFDSIFQDNSSHLTTALYHACQSPMRRGETLYDTLVELPDFSMAKSAGLLFLEERARVTQSVENCPDRGMCRAAIERDAAMQAVDRWRRCELKEFSSEVRCFTNAQTALDYHVASAEVRWLEQERARIERKLRERIDVTAQDVRACEARLTASVPDAWERQQRYENDCVEPYRESRRKPMRDAFAEYGRMLEEAATRLEAAEKLATLNQSS